MIKWLNCLFGFHDLEHLKNVSEWSEMLGCKHCDKLYGYNFTTGLTIPWSADLERFYLRK